MSEDVDDMREDRFRHDAGPYLLGALDEPDRAAFDAHLRGCAGCRTEVAALRPVVAMLGALSSEDAALLLSTGSAGTGDSPDGTDPGGTADPGRHPLPTSAAPVSALTGGDGTVGAGPGAPSPPPMPDTVLPGLLALASRRTRRRRTVLGAVGAVAAAAVVALVVVLLGRPGGAPPQAVAQAVVMQQVTPASAVTATATVTSRPWGTEITLHCRYRTVATGPGYPAHEGPAVYTLRVTDTGGTTHDLGSWTLGSGQQAEFTGGTAVPRAQIRRIDVLAADGMPVLSTAG